MMAWLRPGNPYLRSRDRKNFSDTENVRTLSLEEDNISVKDRPHRMKAMEVTKMVSFSLKMLSWMCMSCGKSVTTENRDGDLGPGQGCYPWS